MMMTRNTMPIGLYLKGVERDLDNLEWNGGSQKSITFLKAEIVRLKAKIAAGETVEPLF